MENKHILQVGDVVRWRTDGLYNTNNGYSRRREAPEPLVVTEVSQCRYRSGKPCESMGGCYVKVRDNQGRERLFLDSEYEHFDAAWFVYDAFLTAVRASRHGK